MGDTEVTEYAIFNTDTHTLELLEYSFAGLSGSPGLLVVSDDRITGKLYDITKGETLQRNYRIFLFSGALTEGDEFLSVPDDVWSLSPFSDGLARVDAWDGTGYIDEYERVVIEPKYERVQLIGENHAVVSETGDYGGGQLPYVTDRSGNRVFPEEYYVDDVIFYNHDDYDLEGVIILVKNKEDANRYFS